MGMFLSFHIIFHRSLNGPIFVLLPFALCLQYLQLKIHSSSSLILEVLELFPRVLFCFGFGCKCHLACYSLICLISNSLLVGISLGEYR